MMQFDILRGEAQPAAEAIFADRSLPRDFVFLSQDPTVGFAAESCISVLRAANKLIGHERYSWAHFVGEETLGDGPICGPGQTLVLIGGMETPWVPSEPRLTQLRACIRSAARVCVVGSAVFAPIAAGALPARQISIHPSFRLGVEETGPPLKISGGATAHHKTLSSAIGPVAAIRMMVELVAAREGECTKQALAEYLGMHDPEEAAQSYEHWRYKKNAQEDANIADALDIMQDHLEDTLRVSQIADLLGVSSRKLQRGFQDRLGQTPLEVYRELRLGRARKLLGQTNLPLHMVSVACGFSNATQMKKWYSRKYGETPKQTRREVFQGWRPTEREVRN